MVKYRFERIKTAEDILEAIGRTDIPSTDVKISVPVTDPETGEHIADFEIDFGVHELSPKDEVELKGLMKTLGYRLKEKE